MPPDVLQIGARWFPEVRAGLERYYYDLTRHLPAAGFNVRGLVLAQSSPRVAPGLEITAYARPDTFIGKRVWRLRRAAQASLNARRVSLIGCHYALYGFPISDIMNTIPTVFHFHGPWSAEGQMERNSLPARWTKRYIEQSLYRRPVAFVALSQAFGETLQRTYGIPEERIFVIPGGVDIARFETDLDQKASRRALGFDEARPLVVTIRRLVHRVGIENLIDGIADVVKKVPDVLLVVGGTGPLEQEIRDQIEQRNLAKNVRLLGSVPEEHLPLVYRAADISIVPSIALEGFGLTTLESLACGTPVLVTPVGGLPEVVRDLSPDLVLSGKAAPALAQGLIAFFNGTLRLPDAAACAAYTRQRFGWPTIARQVANLYAKVLANG